MVVDFCGGTGHVGLVVAALMGKRVRTYVVDANGRALAFCKQRIRDAKLDNVKIWEGDVSKFPHVFDVGVALHACGNASDAVMRRCVDEHAAVVCCPCCVGKVRSNRFADGVADRVRATKIRFARSRRFRAMVSDDEYDALATAADWGHGPFAATAVTATKNKSAPTTAMRTIAKSFLEMDRQWWLREEPAAYESFLMKLRPSDSTPKNDVLVAFPRSTKEDVLKVRPDPDPVIDGALLRLVDALTRRRRLQGGGQRESLNVDVGRAYATLEYGQDAVADAERDLDRLEALTDPSATIRCGGGTRARKLIHLLADLRGWIHRSEGKGASRVVVVTRGRTGSTTAGSSSFSV